MQPEIEVPSHFLCPISMQPMKDPVTVSTGITYDRESIERWLFTCKRTTCPVTKQPLSGTDLIPNHTLRRLILSWCTTNPHYGFDLIPTPKKPLDRSQILKLLNDAKTHPKNESKCLRRMRLLVEASDRSKMCAEDFEFGCFGLFELLANVVLTVNETGFVSEACDDALTVFYHLRCLNSNLRKLVVEHEKGLLNVLLLVMRHGTGQTGQTFQTDQICHSGQSQLHAVTFLKSLFKVMDPGRIASVNPEVFNETVRVLKDNACQQTIKSSLELVIEIVRYGRNRIKAAESGIVFVLIDLLIERSERRVCELMLTVLEQICRCAEGRAKLVEHAAGLATVSKKILRVSNVGSDRAVRILGSVCRAFASYSVLQEMVEVGVVSKLCLMIQVDCSDRTKERVKEILVLHSRVWKDASCIPAHLISSYPSL